MAQSLVRRAESAGFSVFQTHNFCVTGQFSLTHLKIFCLHSWLATNSLSGIFANFSPIRKVLSNSFAFLYFSMQIYLQQHSSWLGFLACKPSFGRLIRAGSKFISPNVKHYVKAWKTNLFNQLFKNTIIMLVVGSFVQQYKNYDKTFVYLRVSRNYGHKP